MKRGITIGLNGIGLFVAFGFSWNFATVCPFAAVYHDGTGDHNLIEMEIREDDIKPLQIVLDRYEENFRVKGDRIYITPKLYFNEQLRWNYSSKAGIQNSNKSIEEQPVQPQRD